MSKKAVDNHARKYSQAYRYDLNKGKKSSKWTTDFEAMALKTVIKLLGNELLCRKRFEEKVRNREIFHGIDLSTAVLAKRETVTLTEEWEAMENVDLEM